MSHFHEGQRSPRCLFVQSRTSFHPSGSSPSSATRRWEALPHDVLMYIVEHMDPARSSCGMIRQVCHAWCCAMDRTINKLHLKRWPLGVDLPARFPQLTCIDLSSSHHELHGSGRVRLLLPQLSRFSGLTALLLPKNCMLRQPCDAMDCMHQALPDVARSSDQDVAPRVVAPRKEGPYDEALLGCISRQLPALKELALLPCCCMECPAIEGAQTQVLAIPPALFKATSFKWVGLRCPDGLQRCTSLVTLRLSYCDLHVVPPPLLSSLRHLTQLDVSHNRISALFSGAVPGAPLLPSLVQLNVSKNCVRELPASLTCLTGLEDLDASSNALTNIQALQPLSTLKNLDLSRNQIVMLPAGAMQWAALQSLDMSYNRLSTVPSTALAECSALQVLNLCNNRLAALPEGLGAATGLLWLSVSFNRLAWLPVSFSRLQRLQDLFLNHNCIMALPPAFGLLSRLRQLDLSNNRQRELPFLSELTSLTTLHVSSNELESLPAAIGTLTALQDLRLVGNRLAEIPESLACCQQLSVLNVSMNRLLALPSSLGSLGQLQELWASSNLLTGLPDSIALCSQLHTLVLDCNQLQELPTTVGELAALTRLSSRDNYLPALPASISRCSALNILQLSGNKLTELPAALGHLTSLSHLLLAHNVLRELPPALGECSALNTLVVHDNALHELPPAVGRLTALRELDVSANKLGRLPDEVGGCKSLQALRVWNNPLLCGLPASLVELSELCELDVDGDRLAVAHDPQGLQALVLGMRQSNPSIKVRGFVVGRLM